MQTRRTKKADQGPAVERNNKKSEMSVEDDQGRTGSHRPKRAASKGIESAIQAAKGVKRAARKKADGGDVGGKKTMKAKKKLKPDEMCDMLDYEENKSEEEEEEKEGPAKKAAPKLAGVVSKGSLDCTSDKVPVYKMGATKKEEEKKTSGLDIYDAFNPIYEDELGHEDKKAKARRAAKARRLAKKKKEEAKIILTFGAAARENVVPAIKTLKNLKTPTQQNHRR